MTILDALEAVLFRPHTVPCFAAQSGAEDLSLARSTIPCPLPILS